MTRTEAAPAANLADRAYAALSRMIRDRTLRPREPILEAPLAERLDVSRTPLREALQRLEGENLVVKGGGRSYVVRGVDLAEYLHSLRTREVIEPEAAVLAAGRIDPGAVAAVRDGIAALEAGYTRAGHWASDAAVHELFLRRCHNPVMAGIVRSLRATTHLFEIDRLSDRLGPDNTEHKLILDALEAGDARAVRRAVAAHIRSLHRFAVSELA